MRNLSTTLVPAGVLLAFLLLSISPAPVAAQDDPVRHDPGSVNLEDLDAWFASPPKLEINIQGALLGMIARAARPSNPELYDVISRVHSISVRTYEQAGPGAAEHIEEIADDLRERGWESAVRVRDRDETVHVLINTSETLISGLTVLVMRPEDESLFVNIIGEIEPEELGRLGRALNLSPLEGLADTHLP